MPINFKVDNIKAKAGKIGSELDIKGLGIWKNASIRCDLNEMLSGNEKCGKLIDVIKIGLKFKDIDNNGNFEFFSRWLLCYPKCRLSSINRELN